jgi:hypothetical protein
MDVCDTTDPKEYNDTIRRLRFVEYGLRTPAYLRVLAVLPVRNVGARGCPVEEHGTFNALIGDMLNRVRQAAAVAGEVNLGATTAESSQLKPRPKRFFSVPRYGIGNARAEVNIASLNSPKDPENDTHDII